MIQEKSVVAKEQTEKVINFERKIIFSNFRNLGIEEKTELLINKSNGECFGELIIVIGANTSGKTGVLNGLMALHNGIDKTLDTPDFVFDNADTYVQLKLVSGEKSWTYEVHAGYQYIYEGNQKIKSEKPTFTLPKALDDFLIKHGHQGIKNKMVASKELTTDEFSTIKQVIEEEYEDNYYQIDTKKKMILNAGFGQYEAFLTARKSADKEVNDKAGVYLLPSILWYKEEEFNQKDLCANVKNLKNSSFFSKVLGMLSISINNIQNVYERFEENGAKQFLTKYQKDVNIKLLKFTERFNRMYAFDENQYNFNFSFDFDKIYFEIFYGDTPLDLDKQSTGFKWFFNFFLNVLNNGKLHKGDIVLMDEPATYLHAHAIAELREFIKTYAKDSGITFIMTTNLPFLIDIDYLDEIRIVKKDGASAKIINDFSLTPAAEDEKDSLFEILGSLTIGRHIMLNPYDRLVFVEGVIDYHFLIAFKKYFGKHNLCMLPINGLKDKNGEIDEKIQEKLCAIAKDPILLVDGDKAGQIAKEKNSKRGLTIFSLKEISDKYKTIEDLFVGNDKDKVSDKNKSKKVARSIKNNYKDLGKFEKETLKNFEDLLDRLEIIKSDNNN